MKKIIIKIYKKQLKIFTTLILLIVIFTGCSLKSDSKLPNNNNGKVGQDIKQKEADSYLDPKNSETFIKTIEQKIKKDKGLDNEMKEKFLNFAAQKIANELLTKDSIEETLQSLISHQEEKASIEIKKIQDLIFQIDNEMDIDIVNMEPKKADQFLANKKLRKICVGIEKKRKIIIVAGNICDKELFETPTKEELNDTERIGKAQGLNTLENSYFVDSHVFTGDKDVLLGFWLRDIEKKATKDYFKDYYKGYYDSYKEITVKGDNKSYCISIELKTEKYKPKMSSDDGKDPDLYEIGDGCK